MSNLQVLPLFVKNREPLRRIETDDLKSSLAKTLKDVPALALAMDRTSLSALSLTDRSCYHAVARHDLWRDMYEPLVRDGAIGPLPATPAWLSNRDVYLSYRGRIRAGRNLIGYSQPSAPWYDLRPEDPFSDPVPIAFDNCQRAAGRRTLEEFYLPHYASRGFIEEVRHLLRQYGNILANASRAVLVSCVFFSLLLKG